MLRTVLANPAHGEALAAAGPCFTAFDDHEPIAAGGVILLDLENSIGRAWALMTSAAGRHMTGITRASRRFFRTADVRRVETPIFIDTPLSIRWAEMLGFAREGLMKAWAPGRDAWLYALVRSN